jgi:hypothetical protein
VRGRYDAPSPPKSVLIPTMPFPLLAVLAVLVAILTILIVAAVYLSTY